ncbi:EpsG family protein [Pseudoalteromonas sp. HL-AS2]|uniref:EpsG family protein n=1 Tax=Pseudoalteromonas sp. HL-AS2 TaxID=3071082 RepID=UPI002816014F|nr:EpsG family protein [Pseudoalteromonas sp. HL-AS2]WMS94899.1 EpsG family protein [Pseudoalteromonas sp. HL-AS2]
MFFYFYEVLCKKEAVGYRYFLFLSLCLLVLLSALRAYNVGTDTGSYLFIWRNGPDELSELFLKNNFFSEPAYALLSFFTKKVSYTFFSQSQIFHLFSISFLVCLFYYSTICKYANYKLFSFVFFFLLGFYTFHFNGARQAIAIALFLYSIKYVLNGNLLKYLAVVLFGFLVHKTMLICLPLYFIFRKELNAKQLILVVVCAVVVALSVTSLVDFASQYDQRYQSYAKSDFEGGGVVAVLFNTSLLMWLWVSKRLNTINDKLYDISLLSMLIAVCIGWVSIILSLNPSGILRLSVYFTQFSIFSLPMSVLYFKNASTRSFVLLSVLIVAVLYFYLTTVNFSGLYPYTVDRSLSMLF